ncbi:MAG TPA: hypothetical protein PKE45_14945, partial [Caldilineaceae bacterium]|nr:hypothetical protein [Caldilineaceae bacterium]
AYVDSYADNGSSNGLIREADETDNAQHFTRAGAPPPAQLETLLPLVSLPASPPPVEQFEASIPFRVDPQGYPFANWGGTPYDDSTDLDPGTLIRMFGAGNVCRSGSTAEDCMLSAAAQEWRSKMLQFVQGGHCYGMAASSQRFYAGLDAPENYQAGANSAHDLQPEPAVRGLITEMAVSQFLRPNDGSSSQFIADQGKKPSEYLALIRQRLLTNPTDPYVLGFSQDGKG